MLLFLFRFRATPMVLLGCVVSLSPCHAQSSSAPTRVPQVVRYEDFGAAGDGKTDDFEALAKAHQHANANGGSVRARDGATYYLGGANRTIPIETDTDFGAARFIIDDTKLENPRAQIFRVVSRQQRTNLADLKSLSKGQVRLGFKLPQPCLIIVTDARTKRFIRRGKNQNAGSAQSEVFLVDTNGVVDPKTPIVWNYERVTRAECLPVDKEPLMLRGGTFTTIASTRETSEYHNRGLSIERSNVVVDGIRHLVQGEGKTGPPYSGFIKISRCSDVIISNSILSGRKTYSKIGSAGERVSMGSYDISLSHAANVALINCSQSNDIMDRSRWGIMGSNFCKNLIFDRCELSRFDAHQGVTNGAIRNSTIGYMGIKLTGGGVFVVENTTVKSRELIDLRPDYGSTWDGDLVIVNCRLEAPPGNYTPVVLGGSNDGQHDFGYPCHLPRNIEIDGLHIEDSGQPKSAKGPAIFANFSPKFINDRYKPPHPQIITREVTYRGLSTASGKALRISDNPHMFRGVRIEAQRK